MYTTDMIKSIKQLTMLHIHALFPLRIHSERAQNINTRLLWKHADIQIHKGHITICSLSNETVAEVIYALKYERHQHSIKLVQKLLKTVIEDECIAQSEIIKVPFVLCTIPQTKTRSIKEEYDQLDELAKGIIKSIKKVPVEYHKNLLSWKRTVSRQSQTKNYKERLSNVSGAMVANPYTKNATHIIIDDVTTTGSSLSEAKRALQDAGIENVITVAFARA